ncbi:GTPase activating protein for Arf [Aspergillus nomiae NRRL 13137]|uniref:GTPase activating protein for Arf n=1 Tax=Aspergillus nomiae NRRL (strain ATCC 15546 / NRRL 13137 / CBS 260.88 / M93) TaxID=1509407 RepID=A0A0L1J364_ASPN3|nr:GTPase activating protein for Arf [Aspergillus nomiae NRRL 13137]KNG86194.1 GTPase activating protein for Arf [Aspergillus nomiae NRRL 13137]
MVAGISKRQQFRNERALQDLIRSVPGNDRCADCQAMNPGWASWNMGIFLCMRCAALHRKMGTHISKVKSLSMDSWTTEQVDNMKSHGNNLMNKIFNPRNVKPPVPADVDESDACMERFIRQKYQYRTLEEGKPKPPSRQGTRDDRSPEGAPPPLPPKPARPYGFGLRSASSTTSLHRLSNRQAMPPRSETYESPRAVSQGMGASVGSSNASHETQMATLRSMGFTNEYRNSAVLKGLDGNLDKSIETLVRLGEGPPSLQGRTPVQTTTANDTARQQASSNPFDQLDSKPTQPAGQSYNPFDVPTPQPAAQTLEASFQHLQVSQPLFPHSTGGYPNQQPSFPQPLYQQPMTPPVMPTISQGAVVQSPQPVDGGHNPFFQSGSFTAAPNQTPGVAQPQTNPFFTQPPSQLNSMQPPSQAPAGYPHPPRHANTMPAISSTSPFGTASPFQQQQQQQIQPPQLQVQPPQFQAQPPQQMQASHNPFQPMTAPPTPQSAGTAFCRCTAFLHQHRQRQSSLNPQERFPAREQHRHRPLAMPLLRNHSNPRTSIPQAPGTPSSPLKQQLPDFPNSNSNKHTSNNPNPNSNPQYSTFTMPMKSNTMPPAAPSAFPRPQGHMSQQSVDINAFQNGRHSPDAFASLSARYG